MFMSIRRIASVLAAAIGLIVAAEPVLESRFSSRDYGAKEASVSVCWTERTALPFAAQFLLIPVSAVEDSSARLRLGRLIDLGNANHVG